MPVDCGLIALVVTSGVLLIVSGSIGWKERHRFRRWWMERHGQRWRAQLDEDRELVCEECEKMNTSGPPTGHSRPMIVNKPIRPGEPVDLDEETQVLCQAHVKQRLEHPE